MENFLKIVSGITLFAFAFGFLLPVIVQMWRIPGNMLSPNQLLTSTIIGCTFLLSLILVIKK